jgi:predicted amidohydrolase
VVNRFVAQDLRLVDVDGCWGWVAEDQICDVEGCFVDVGLRDARVAYVYPSPPSQHLSIYLSIYIYIFDCKGLRKGLTEVT